MGRGRRVGSGVWVSYLGTGAVLAISRVALFVLWYYQIVFPLDWHLLWVFYFEDLLGGYTRLGMMSDAVYLFVWIPILTLISFLMATPILLVGWLMRSRRQDLARS